MRFKKKTSSQLTLFLLSFLFAICLAATVPTGGQSCTPLDPNLPAWPRNSPVFINLGNLNTEQQRQVRAGIDAWNQANQTNGSYVRFSYDAPPSSTSFRLNFQIGQTVADPQTGQRPPAQLDRTNGVDGQGNLNRATVTFDTSVQAPNQSGNLVQALNETTSSNAFFKAALHEIGHSMGFGEGQIDPAHPTSGPCGQFGQIGGSTVMNGLCGANDWGGNLPTSVTPCDNQRIPNVYQCSLSAAACSPRSFDPASCLCYDPSPTPTPDPCASQADGSGPVIANALCTGDGGDLEESGMGECNDGIDNDQDGLIDCDEGSCGHYCVSGCSSFQQDLCVALGAMGCWQGQCYTPILIDVNGDGYKMTNVDNGVSFKVLPSFPLTKVSWTAENSDDAWLVLDRNGNRTIDSGEEQFGNATPQPWSMEKNGFKALAQYDYVFNGGHEDGIIDGRDVVFAQLRLWCDRNHNGISESDELTDLPSAGLFGIDLNYKEWKKVDEFGNAFRYRAKVLDGSGHSLGKWAFDVFLNTH